MLSIVNEEKRGCGFRSQGGTYLVSEGVSGPCGLLPLPMIVCPCCGGGIKPARGVTWIEPGKFLPGPLGLEDCGRGGRCFSCPVAHPPERAVLLWVGGVHYPTPAAWSQEASLQGASRKVPAMPIGFTVGETWVYVAHREVIPVHCPDCMSTDSDCNTCGGSHQVKAPAIFHAYRPTRVDYILKDEELEAAAWLEAWGAADLDNAQLQAATWDEGSLKVQGAPEHLQKKVKRLHAMEQRGITLVNLVRTDGQDVHGGRTR